MLDLPSPCVVVVGSFVNPKSIVKQILKCDSLPEALCLGENVEGFPWEIDTKYYKACVNICPVNNEDVLPEKLFNSAEGLILYFDSQNVDSFDNVKKWNDQMKETPEVLLLVCDKFYDNSSEVSRSSALAWCLQHGYELVELQEPEEAGSGDYDIIPDRKGADRICEALEAHTWSNLDMKAHSNTNPPGAHSPDLNLEADTEDFMELFSQLQSMRESIQSLPPRDRHACAEQVVATFWRAVGGDEEEVQGILDLE